MDKSGGVLTPALVMFARSHCKPTVHPRCERVCDVRGSIASAAIAERAPLDDCG